MEEWQACGVILYTIADHIPRLKIIMGDHTYEIQACKFDPIMQRFAVLIDGEFKASQHDSLERLLQLDEISKSRMCSEKEKLLMNQIEILKEQINNILNENRKLEQNYNDAKIIIFDGV